MIVLDHTRKTENMVGMYMSKNIYRKGRKKKYITMAPSNK